LVSPIKRTVRTSSASTRLKDAEHTALVANAGGRLTQAPRRIGSHSLGEFPLDVVRNDTANAAVEPEAIASPG
jgi:hypothetical protein